MTKGTKDGQNVERVVRKRYAFNSGQDSIHGSTLFQAETQESQSFGFYGSTYQIFYSIIYTITESNIYKN